MAAARVLLIAGLLALSSVMSAAQSPPTLMTQYDLGQAPPSLRLDDPVSVFAFVLERLPDRVPVYPTENYVYVRFAGGGVTYTGNVRLAAADRDAGKVHFAYGVAPSERRPEPAVRYGVLDRTKDVALRAIDPLTYEVTHRSRTVTFAINEVRGVRPPAGLLRTDEVLIGPVFDESAVRFFLVFNARLKAFHYLLDESGPPADEWIAEGEALLIGRRTGFAFYRDGDRQVLVGVKAASSRLNDLFDGPFDQLPENIAEGETLRDAIVAADPAAKGKIDRLGHYLDGSGRYLVHPYMLYRRPADLAVFRRCMTDAKVAPGRRPLCFVIADEQSRKGKPLPQALRGR